MEAKNRDKKKKNEQNLIEMWDTIPHTNVCIMGIPGKREKKKKILEEILTENFPNLVKKITYTSRDLDELWIQRYK